MSEASPNQEGSDFKKFSEDFAKRLEEISSGISTLNIKVEDKTSELEKKIEASVKKEDDDDYSSKFSNYDTEENKKMEAVADKKLNDFKANLDKEKAYYKECSEFDNKAFKDFPIIKNNPAIQKQIQDEIKNTMRPIGKDSEGKAMYPTDAVYNAAARIVAKMGLSGTLQDLPEPEGMDVGSYPRKIQGRDVNDIQMDIANKLGIKPERAREIYKDFKPGVRRQ